MKKYRVIMNESKMKINIRENNKIVCFHRTNQYTQAMRWEKNLWKYIHIIDNKTGAIN